MVCAHTGARRRCHCLAHTRWCGRTYWTFKSYQDITTQVRWSGLSMFGKRYLRARVPQNGATESWYNADGSIQVSTMLCGS
jgi:hypothetical protein